MLVTKLGSLYVCLCQKSESFRPKAAGFTWWKIAKDHWATKSPLIASRLAKWASDELRSEFQPHCERRLRNLQASSQASADTTRLPVPDGLTLMEYQSAGVTAMASLDRILLADEMGLGKTIQAITLANLKRPGSMLVVCPASLRLLWKEEIEKWSTRKLDICCCMNWREWRDAECVIVNYDVLPKLAQQLSRGWDMLVADEAHFIKNPKAKRTRAFWSIKAEIALLMTGTPILNRPIELFTLVSYLWKEWRDWHWYVTMFCDAQQGTRGFDVSGSSNRPLLNRLLRESGMIRRLKRDVLKQLPPVTRQVIAIPCELNELLLREINEYKRFTKLRFALKSLAKVSAKHQDDRDFRERIMTLRDQVRLSFQHLSILRKQTAVAKIPSLISHLEDVLADDEGKVVCFAHHTEVIEKVLHAFSKVACSIYGKTKQSERQAIVAAFQRDGGARLFIGGIRAAGMGLTLTASHHAVFGELDWTPAMLSQSEKRIDRIGQAHPMLVQYVVFDGSLDCYMAKRIVAKQSIIEEALGDV